MQARARLNSAVTTLYASARRRTCFRSRMGGAMGSTRRHIVRGAQVCHCDVKGAAQHMAWAYIILCTYGALMCLADAPCVTVGCVISAIGGSIAVGASQKALH